MLPILALIGPALAQTPTPPARAARWSIVAGAGHCTLQRNVDGVQMLAVRQDIGAPVANLLIRQPEAVSYRGVPTTVTLRPSGIVFHTTASGRTGDDGAPLLQLFADPLLVEQLASADDLEVRVAGGPAISLPVDRPAASERLAICQDTSLRSLGVDPARFRPTLGPGQPGFVDHAPLLTARDYPRAALRAKAQGKVITLLAIDERGAVSNCRVLETSGNADLDTRTCEIAQARLTYPPARDGAAQPTASWTSFSIRWAVPR